MPVSDIANLPSRIEERKRKVEDGAGQAVGDEVFEVFAVAADLFAADSKERAAMIEMRGEMMKAMGDIMMKHGRRMQGMTGN